MKKNLIVDLTFDFALCAIAFGELLETNRRYVVAKQLVKSGTSIGANVREAQSAESRNDFIHKLKIAAKEAEEQEYWLLLCKHSKNYPDPGAMLDKVDHIKRILTRIICSAKNG